MLKIRANSIEDIQNEVQALVARGIVGRYDRLYQLSRYFDDSQWPRVENLLTQHDYFLRDSVIDLVGKESWDND